MSCSSAPVTATSRSMPGEGGRDRADRLGDGEAVLEQPVAVGLVVELRRRRVAVGRPALRARADQPLEQHPQVRLLDRRDQLAQVGLHLLGIAQRAVEQIVELVGSRLGRAQRAQVDLRAVARVHDVAADHAHRLPRGHQRRDVAHAVPDHRDDLPRAIAERQAQELAAVAFDALVDLADEQHLVQIGPVGYLADEHVRKVARPADDYGMCDERERGGQRRHRRTRQRGHAHAARGRLARRRALRRRARARARRGAPEPRAARSRPVRRRGRGGGRRGPAGGSARWSTSSAASPRAAACTRRRSRTSSASFRLNLRPTYLLCQAALPRLLDGGGGSIVCVSTRAALRPFPGAAGYIASKAAVLAFVDALAASTRTTACAPTRSCRA